LHKAAGGNSKFSVENKAFKNIPAAKKTDDYGSASAQTLLVNGNYLHDHGYRGEGMLITVLDAGFLSVDTHPVFDSMRAGGRLLDMHNFVLNTDDIYGYDHHGTEVLSIMAGNEPGIYIGAAPYAQYALYITEDDNSEQPVEMDNLLAATERADSLGTDVISVSLGYDIFDNSSLSYSDIDGKSTDAAKAANMATQKGILFVSSAGNDGSTPWHYILTPGDADSALTVGAVYANKTSDPISGHGPNSGGQRKPDVCDLGADVIVADAFSSGLGADAGTSMATPQIAGWATCLWQANSKLKPAAIRNTIIKSADHYTSPDYNVGWGTPDFQTALMLLGVNDTPNPSVANWAIAGPNPFTNEINVQLDLTLSQTVYFNLIDVAGRTIIKTSRQFNPSAGSMVSLPVPANLPGGIYLLRIGTNSQKTTLKLEHH
ncbi:MAG: S8 family serine peptidase, partial [Flavipsychrobacter sp.]